MADDFPVKVDLSCTQGDDYSKGFRLRDGLNALYDLTGWTGKAQMRSSTGSFLAEFTVTINQAVAAGVVLVSLTRTVTETIPAATHKWDLEMIDAGGFKQTYLSGDFLVKPQVTKDVQ